MAELALTGQLRGVHGVIPAILAAQKSKRELIIAKQNANEASLVSDQNTYLRKRLFRRGAISQWSGKITPRH